MNSDFNDDDVTQYLPTLKRENLILNNLVNDYEGDSWYEKFINEVKNDVDPQKLQELVVDYLICGGYAEAAKLLCQDAEIKFPQDAMPSVESLPKREVVRSAIVNGDLESALLKIKELVPDLLQKNSKLHFKLLRQQLVELIRKKDIDKVLSFAQDNLIDKCEQPPELFTKLEQTYALLAFDNPEKSPFGYLMNLNQRNILANEVNAAILNHLNKNSTSKLENLFRVMVWNHNQLISRGDASASPLKRFCPDVVSEISREIFGSEDNGNEYDLLHL